MKTITAALIGIACISWGSFGIKMAIEAHKKRKKLEDNRKPVRVIDQYEPVECGMWETQDSETGETLEQGKMFSVPMKVEFDDGTIGMHSHWVSDKEL